MNSGPLIGCVYTGHDDEGKEAKATTAKNRGEPGGMMMIMTMVMAVMMVMLDDNG